MQTLRLVLAAGLFAGVASLSLGQENAPKSVPMTPLAPPPGKPVEPTAPKEPYKPVSLGDEKDAAKILEKAKTAALAVRDVTATIEAWAKAGAEETPPNEPRVKGHIIATFKKGAPFPLGLWRIERSAKGDDKAPQPVFSFDGANMLALDHAKKELRQTPPAMGFAVPDGEEQMLLPMWYFEQRMDMLAMLKPTVKEQAFNGDIELDGVKCALVKQVREATLPDEGDDEDEPPADKDGKKAEKKPRMVIEQTIVALARTDSLPRRMERSVSIKDAEGEQVMQQMTQVMTGVKANTDPAKAAFEIKLPEGYALKKIEPGEGAEPGLAFKEGDQAPDFALKDAAGTDYSLASLKGKVVLMDFWATWCGPCIAAMPSIQKIHEHFAGKPVAILGVNTWERKAGAGPAFMEKKKFTYPCLLAGDELATKYGISGIPTLIVFDGAGKILHTGVGFGPDEEKHLIEVIEAALAKK